VIQHFVLACYRRDNFVGVADPLEGFAVSAVVVEEAVDGGLKVDDGSEDAALQPPLARRGEEALDGVEPRGGGRREVEGPAWPPPSRSTKKRLCLGFPSYETTSFTISFLRIIRNRDFFCSVAA
jgi:hypothetical protein